MFILNGEPYAAGQWDNGSPRDSTIHEFFQTCARSEETKLSLYESDPVLLKCLLGLCQNAPATQATSDLVSIEGLLDRLKQDGGENLLVLKSGREYSFFYFMKKRMVEAYFSDAHHVSGEDSLEDALLSYVYSQQSSQPIELLLYNDLKIAPAPDVQQSTSDDFFAAVVDHYLKPRPRLIVLGPENQVKNVILNKKAFVIGRDSDSDLVLDDLLVSRRHAVVRCQNGEYSIQDESSRNGILVNGESVTESHLSDGDKIQVGNFRIQFFKGDGGFTVKKGSAADTRDETMVGSAQSLLNGRANRQRRCWLEVIVGQLRGLRYEVTEVRTVMGRSQADFIIKDPKVSRQHATIEWTEEGYKFIDHGSTNGSFVNDQRVSSQLMASGDRIRIGDTTIKVTVEK